MLDNSVSCSWGMHSLTYFFFFFPQNMYKCMYTCDHQTGDVMIQTVRKLAANGPGMTAVQVKS